MQHVQLFHPTDGWQVGIGERKRKSENRYQTKQKQFTLARQSAGATATAQDDH
jgi:hypothetical protein